MQSFNMLMCFDIYIIQFVTLVISDVQRPLEGQVLNFCGARSTYPKRVFLICKHVMLEITDWRGGRDYEGVVLNDHF